MRSLLGTIIWAVGYFRLAIPFWLEEFLLKDQLLSLWESPCVLFVVFPLVLLMRRREAPPKPPTPRQAFQGKGEHCSSQKCNISTTLKSPWNQLHYVGCATLYNLQLFHQNKIILIYCIYSVSGGPASKARPGVKGGALHLPKAVCWAVSCGVAPCQLLRRAHAKLDSSHVWMWELAYKEGWALKNSCFWTVVLEKALESPLDCKEIKPVNPKGNIHRKDGRWSWSSNTLAIWCKEPTHWKRPWYCERLKAEEGDDRGRDGWMASLIQWTQVWASSRRCWRTGKPGLLQSVRSQRVGHDWATEQQQHIGTAK